MRAPSAKPITLPGIRIGHASDDLGLTGCTVILAEAGATCAVDVRGSASGSRELATCRPDHLVPSVHAIFLTGGSAFGLDAAQGVMQYLEARGIGFAAGRHRIPIVPAAVIFDLNLGRATARPDAAMARRACRRAAREISEGSIGAGTGATVGKLFGTRQSTKAGVGFASLKLASGATVQALAVVNAFGDVVDPQTGRILAGARTAPHSAEFAGTARLMLEGKVRKAFGANTTLVAVMTNAALSKTQAGKVAEMAQDGLARAIRPVHTQFDGDLVFALALGNKQADIDTLGTAAAEATARAIVRALLTARGRGGVPSCSEMGASKPEGRDLYYAAS